MLNIFPKFIILYIIIFYIYNKLYINCEPVCSDFTDCFNCTMCGDENSKYCNCVWEPDIGGEYICQTDEFRYLSEWYKELKQCNFKLYKISCYNPRKVRGGKTTSLHAYASAIVNPKV